MKAVFKGMNIKKAEFLSSLCNFHEHLIRSEYTIFKLITDPMNQKLKKKRTKWSPGRTKFTTHFNTTF